MCSSVEIESFFLSFKTKGKTREMLGNIVITVKVFVTGDLTADLLKSMEQVVLGLLAEMYLHPLGYLGNLPSLSSSVINSKGLFSFCNV